MTRRTFARELENAASRIADISQSDLEALLRRAALRFRNSTGLPLEPHTDDILAAIAAGLEMSKADLISRLLTKWLEDNGYLPERPLLYQSNDSSYSAE